MTFFGRLEARVQAIGSMLCIGLDPRVDSAVEARAFCRKIIEATLPHAAVFKPNAAFFEALGPSGYEVLIEVVASIPEEVPVLLDAKRGDIGSTAVAYAKAAFQLIGADAVTVSPYLGSDSIAPFLDHEGSGVFVLCRTSNPGGGDFQDAVLSSGDPLYVEVARTVACWAGPQRFGLVVGATEPDALGMVRAAAPEHWILAPGVGAQGGSLEQAVAMGIRSDGMGLLLPVSRAISGSSDPGAAAEDLVVGIDRIRTGTRPSVDVRGSALAVRLFDAGCVRLGDFRLKSGAHSPIYLDLRILAGHPALTRRVARHLVPLLGPQLERSGEAVLLDPTPSTLVGSGHKPLRPFDRLAGVPLAGLPVATAVSLESGIPMVYPRPRVKDHGTRSAVEGPFRPGDRAVIVDDVVTSGSSILEAAARLREAGLVVDTAAVLIDRGGEASAALAVDGIELRSVLSLAMVLDELRGAGRITTAEVTAAAVASNG